MNLIVFIVALAVISFVSSKETSHVYITFKLDGTTYVVQNCQSTPGFYCETN